jgi:hypothetical protein
MKFNQNNPAHITLLALSAIAALFVIIVSVAFAASYLHTAQAQTNDTHQFITADKPCDCRHTYATFYLMCTSNPNPPHLQFTLTYEYEVKAQYCTRCGKIVLPPESVAKLITNQQK